MLTVTRSGYDGNSTKLSKILLNGNNICMVWAFLFPLSRQKFHADSYSAYSGRRGTSSSTVIVSLG